MATAVDSFQRQLDDVDADLNGVCAQVKENKAKTLVVSTTVGDKQETTTVIERAMEAFRQVENAILQLYAEAGHRIVHTHVYCEYTTSFYHKAAKILSQLANQLFSLGHCGPVPVRKIACTRPKLARLVEKLEKVSDHLLLHHTEADIAMAYRAVSLLQLDGTALPTATSSSSSDSSCVVA